MKDLSSLLYQKDLKQEFMASLMMHLSSLSKEVVESKLITLKSDSFNTYIRLFAYNNVMKEHEKYPFEEGKRLYGDISSGEELFQISEEEFALWEKINHIVFGLGDFSGAVRLLNSLDKGVKRLKDTDKTAHVTPKQERAEWKESAHGEYLSMGANDPKAHFRWNYGKRYILTTKTLDKVYQFLCNHNLKLDEL